MKFVQDVFSLLTKDHQNLLGRSDIETLGGAASHFVDGKTGLQRFHLSKADKTTAHSISSLNGTHLAQPDLSK
jgi:hypothetical protein